MPLACFGEARPSAARQGLKTHVRSGEVATFIHSGLSWVFVCVVGRGGELGEGAVGDQGVGRCAAGVGAEELGAGPGFDDNEQAAVAGPGQDAGHGAGGAAAGGAEALAMLREGSFDLVLLDLMMPGMNGFDVLAAMKQGKT